MLADELAAHVDQLLSAFLLQSLVIPAAGEGDLHGSSGADRANAQEEGGVAGNHFGVGVSANIAHHSLVGGELTGVDHLVQLQTGSDTGKVAALIDGGESVVVVGQALGVSAGAGAVAELNIGILLSGLDHERLMTEAVGEDDVAALVDHIDSGLIALLALGNVGLEDVVGIGQTQVGDGFLGGVDEVLVIGGVLIVQGDEAHLDLGGRIGIFVAVVTRRGVLGLAAGHQAQRHDQCEQHCKELFHSCFPP